LKISVDKALNYNNKNFALQNYCKIIAKQHLKKLNIFAIMTF